MNNAAIIGNLVDDPELRFTPSGTAFAKFSIADNYKKDDVEKVSFFDAVVWGEQAEHLAESLKKGQRVVAVGRIEQNRWQAEDGTNRSRVEFVVTDIGPSVRWALVSVTPTGGTNQPDYPAGAPQLPTAAPAAAPDVAPFF